MSDLSAPLLAWILLAHLIGDYIIQSNWMAQTKTSQWWPAIAHGVTYTVPFAAINLLPGLEGSISLPALAVIGGTHIIIDRFRLAKHLVWLKNLMAPKAYRSPRTATGYPDDTPPFLSVWLMIIVDNTAHLLINLLAVIYIH